MRRRNVGWIVVFTMAFLACASDPAPDDAPPPSQQTLDTALCSGEPSRSCYSGPPATEGVGECRPGFQDCVDGGWSECTSDIPPGEEKCDFKDNDCNGLDDEGCNCTVTDPPRPCYTAAKATEGVGGCKTGAQRCVGGAWSNICFDEVTPTAEVCDNIDNDCDGLVDEGLKCECTEGATRSCYSGPPATENLGICKDGSQTCVGRHWGACSGQVLPGTETCDNVDQNCNGVADDGAPCAAGLVCTAGQCVTPPPSTCPFVYAFDGSQYRYQTTVGGASLTGSSADAALGRAMAFEPMWARLDHEAVSWQGKLGTARAKLLIAEDEIGYVDEVGLTVVEHPIGTEVFSSSSAQWATLGRTDPEEFYALRTAGLRAPRAASWTGPAGKTDITKAIGSLDEVAVPFDRTIDNAYDLDFGDVKDPAHAKLVIDGWKFKEVRGLPSDAPRLPPRIEVEQVDGHFTTALYVAPPRGDRKTVVVDLASIPWPLGRYRVRFHTGTGEDGLAMWYVDRVRFTEAASAPIQVASASTARASLAFFGAPTLLDTELGPTPASTLGSTNHPRWNRDDGKGPLAKASFGSFTRYGDVGELLSAADDRLVVMRQGDGIELGFEGVQRPRAGRQIALFLRTELLFKPRVAVGSNEPTKASASVLPLPFHGMTRYPYGPNERAPAASSFGTREILPPGGGVP